jgi:hypothetical protein
MDKASLIGFSSSITSILGIAKLCIQNYTSLQVPYQQVLYKLKFRFERNNKITFSAFRIFIKNRLWCFKKISLYKKDFWKQILKVLFSQPLKNSNIRYISWKIKD